ncbi:unnamed protein product [Adineta ricciae]|uniref:Uncharacterized protein n=1 Tax=Adineta ricciae TaxID=249248 RepID=A0A815PYB0_ADIRI|nr:unnamed protein product [Adineta ricciae]CAF1564423.1 unnamed protein product [Adineta ricciae]
MKRKANNNDSVTINNNDMTIEGIPVAVTNMTQSDNNVRSTHWSTLICDANQTLVRITKFVSSNTRCTLHQKIIDHMNNQTGVSISKVKQTSDDAYIANHQTIATPKSLSFSPKSLQIISIEEIQKLEDEQYVSFNCKILDVGEEEKISFYNNSKKTEKTKLTATAGDETQCIKINLWEGHLNKIKKNQCYKVKLMKTKTFNNEISLTTTVYTTFEEIKDLGPIECTDLPSISNNLTISGFITSIGFSETNLTCPKCFSNQVETTEKTIKCLTCKTRSILSKQDDDHKKIKTTISTESRQSFDLITELSKIKVLLEQLDHSELCQRDLVEDEEVIIILTSNPVSVNFNVRTNNIINMEIYQANEG